MKKILLIAVSALTIGFTAAAQDTFYPGWQYGIKGGASYTAAKAPIGRLISGPTLAIFAGYNFSPVWTVRAELSGYQAKGSFGPTPDFFNYKHNYVQLNADMVADICNMFKYKARRGVNPYILAGVGVCDRFNNGAGDFINEMNDAEYVWKGAVIGFTGRAGLGINFRCSDAVAIELEVLDNFHSNKFNSQKESWALDQNVSAMLGFKFSFGQANKRHAAEAAAAAAAAAAAKAAADKAEADRLAAEEAARAKAEADSIAAAKAAAEAEEAARLAAEEAAKARQSTNGVMFKIGQYNLNKAAKKKVQEVADFLEAHPDATVMVSGYADKETGYASRNLYLSKKRAEVTAAALKKAGVAADRINTEYFGDTKKISEIPAENRTACCVTK